MKISGFTFMKNTSKLYYPLKESIESILPIVDEFVILLGDSDKDDNTLEIINSINSNKIKIFHSIWDSDKYDGWTIYAQQTDEAMSHCSGDWLFYLQSDEVVHEKYLNIIKNACEYYKNDKEVEGLLFGYIHFWGDFNHYHKSHGWYKNEIRVIRNHIKDLHSYKDAQSFRIIPDFKDNDYRRKINTRKLNVAKIDAYINHYGWVRPPYIMNLKNPQGKVISDKYDYGPLDEVAIFTDSHPAVMKKWISKFNWQDELYSKSKSNIKIHKHQSMRVKILTWLEGILYNHKDSIFF